MLAEDDPRHNTVNGYTNLKCRCPKCTRANTLDHYDRMHANPQRLIDHARRERARKARGNDV